MRQNIGWGGAGVGKVQRQRQLPWVEYLLWVVHKVDNQQMHKSQQLSFTGALQAAPQSFIHFLLILWMYSRPQHAPKHFFVSLASPLNSFLLTLAQ